MNHYTYLFVFRKSSLIVTNAPCECCISILHDCCPLLHYMAAEHYSSRTQHTSYRGNETWDAKMESGCITAVIFSLQRSHIHYCILFTRMFHHWWGHIDCIWTFCWATVLNILTSLHKWNSVVFLVINLPPRVLHCASRFVFYAFCNIQRGLPTGHRVWLMINSKRSLGSKFLPFLNWWILGKSDILFFFSYFIRSTESSLDLMALFFVFLALFVNCRTLFRHIWLF